jgi:hypothetical protein
MHDTTFPGIAEGFSHHDSHHYANDERQIAIVLVGLAVSSLPLVAFIVALLNSTPR